MDKVIDYIINYMHLIRFTDIIDIFIVAVLTYNLGLLIRETRAMQLVKGVAILFLAVQLSSFFNLTTLNYMLQTTMQVGAFALLVIFQPELRSILERMGRTKVSRLLDFFMDVSMPEENLPGVVEEIVTAAVNMSKNKTGALIALERDTKLGEYITTGTVLNADVSANLLENIFFVNTPLHDGAVIIRKNKIVTAACFLPLTSNDNLSRELGTRHRAALGLSEVSDAVIIIVSEETGTISIAKNGSLSRKFSAESLKKALMKSLSNRPSDKSFDKIKFWKGMKK